MEAKASRTLRRYGFCALDRWTAEEAALAEELLKHVRAEGDLQRSAVGMGGDEDAWIWGDSRPPIEEALDRAVVEVVGGDGEMLVAAAGVKERLLGEYHLPAVKEALGCLIPRELNPRLDGVVPKGKTVPGSVPGGVHLEAGTWKVDVKEERDLYEDRALSKGMLEFFLIVLRRVCEVLDLRVGVGTHKMGELICGASDAGELQRVLGSFASWKQMEKELPHLQELALPVPLGEGKGILQRATFWLLSERNTLAAG